MENPVYDPAYFDAPTLYEAKRLMFPGDPEKFEERWNGDTAFLRDMLIRELQPKVGDLLLDYGCGIGRIAREMCLLGCNVIGVESSAVCRRYAVEYVNQPGHFLAVSPEEFDLLNRKGLKCDLGCAFWTLQHCAAPAADIERISRGLKTLSRLLIANAGAAAWSRCGPPKGSRSFSTITSTSGSSSDCTSVSTTRSPTPTVWG